MPEKPVLLDSAVPDEAAAAAEQEQQRAQALADAQDKLNQAQTALNEALQAQQDAGGSGCHDDAAPACGGGPAAYDAARRRRFQPAELNPNAGTPIPSPTAPEEPQSEPDSDQRAEYAV